MIIDGKPFDPASHFKDHRMEHEKEAARRRAIAINRLLKVTDMPPHRGRNALMPVN
jgi:hypothetical protein